MVVHGTDPSIQPECWESGSEEGARVSNWAGGSRMPYVLVKENFLKWWIRVEGIGHGDARHLSEKIGEQPEEHCEDEKAVEFSIPSWMVGSEWP